LAESAFDYATEVYPNPANDQLTISFVGIPNNNIDIVVTDVNGKQLHSESIETSSYNEKLVLDVKNYMEGIYFVEIATDNQKMVERIVVTHK